MLWRYSVPLLFVFLRDSIASLSAWFSQIRELVEQVVRCSWPENLRICGRNQQASFPDILRIYNVFVKVACTDPFLILTLWAISWTEYTTVIADPSQSALAYGWPARTYLALCWDASMFEVMLLPGLRFIHGITAKGRPHLLGDLSLSISKILAKLDAKSLLDAWCRKWNECALYVCILGVTGTN